MPQLDEVVFYMRSLWLVVLDPAQGLSRLDLTTRGARRSFWAIAWCIPPILLSWAAYRINYLGSQPEVAGTGPGFFFRLAIVEIGCWLIPLLAVSGVMMAVGFTRRLPAVVVALNWLMVPSSWMMALYSGLLILSPDNAASFALLYLICGIIVLTAQSMVLNVMVSGQKLLVGTIVITNLVTTLYVSLKLQVALGLV